MLPYSNFSCHLDQTTKNDYLDHGVEHAALQPTFYAVRHPGENADVTADASPQRTQGSLRPGAKPPFPISDRHCTCRLYPEMGTAYHSQNVDHATLHPNGHAARRGGDDDALAATDFHCHRPKTGDSLRPAANLPLPVSV